MAVNQQLLQPEQGWRRYDDTDSNIEYIGDWKTYVFNGLWEGNQKYTNDSNAIVRFNFTGSKIRILSEVSTDKREDNKIIIDDEEYILSEYSSTKKLRVVVFESINLNDTEHYVEMKPSPSVIESSGYGFNMGIDAIDIESNRELKPYRKINRNHLIKQGNDYYTTNNNYYKLGTSKDKTELKKWLSEYGANNILNLQDSYNNKIIPVDKFSEPRKIYESLDVDFNDVKKPYVYMFKENDSKRKLEYDVDSYKIIDEIRKINNGIGNVVFKEY